MKIAVCVKQVPVVSMLKFDNETKRIVREGVPSEVNHFDMLATNAAVALKAVTDIEVIAITMGPPQARDALVQCIASGADRAIHLTDRAFAGADTLATARALAAAIEREGVDLILCGRNSIDAETGQVGPEIAEFLGIPQVTAVRNIHLLPEGKGLLLQRVTDDGHEIVSCPLPALLTITEDAAPEMFPSREAMEAARNGRIDEVNAAVLSDDLSCFGAAGSPTWVGEVYAVESKREGILVRDVSPEEAVDQLMRFLESRGVFDDSANINAASKIRQPRVESTNSAPVLAVAEILSGKLRSVSLELLGGAAAIAQGLGTRAEAVLIGHGASDHVQSLTDHGADRVYLADNPVFAGYDTEVYAHALCEAIAEAKPCAVLMASTTQGRDLAGRVAGRLRLGLTGDCIGLELDAEQRLVQLKPAFGGNIVAPILSRTIPNMTTVRPGILEPLNPMSGIEPLITYLPLQTMPVRKVEVIEHAIDESIQGAELENASVIVGVGMGIGGPENLGPVRELADALSAPIGATRDVTDQGWMPRQYQIGVSGKSVSPALYIAVALRGPFNHSVGIKRAGTIVAINNNRRAAIFREADFGILGDYADIVPVLTRAIRTRLSK